MPMFISLLSFGCFGGADASFLRYDGKYLELLILCAVILFSASVSSIGCAAVNGAAQHQRDKKSDGAEIAG
jgi:hypothetical protein